jgi:hypothetical protein
MNAGHRSKLTWSLAMTASPTPEQSARAILDIFRSQNCIAGDPLKISYIKTKFLEDHGSAADYTGGLLYAEDNGWLEVTLTGHRGALGVTGTATDLSGDLQPPDTLTLTAVGFAEI